MYSRIVCLLSRSVGPALGCLIFALVLSPSLVKALNTAEAAAFLNSLQTEAASQLGDTTVSSEEKAGDDLRPVVI